MSSFCEYRDVGGYGWCRPVADPVSCSALETGPVCGCDGGSASIDVIDAPAGIVRAAFQGFQLRHCINQSATCTLTGTIETHGTGVFE